MFGWTEPGRGLGLAAKAAHGLLVLQAVLADDLDGDDAVRAPLAGLVDDAHAAAAELFEDLEVGQTGRRLVERTGRIGGTWRLQDGGGVVLIGGIHGRDAGAAHGTRLAGFIRFFPLMAVRARQQTWHPRNLMRNVAGLPAM